MATDTVFFTTVFSLHFENAVDGNVRNFRTNTISKPRAKCQGGGMFAGVRRRGGFSRVARPHDFFLGLLTPFFFNVQSTL